MRTFRLLVILVLVGGIGAGLWLYWDYEALHPSTDDAQVQANIVSIAAQVGGPVVSVEVTENAPVKEGDVMFVLDPAPYRAALEQAEAQLQIASQTTGASTAQVSAAEASIQQAQAALTDAEANLGRQKKLFVAQDVAKAAVDAAQSTRDQAAAALGAAKANAEAARSTRGPLGANPAAIRQAQAAVDVAKLNLDHATVRAPASGWIANLSLRPGSVVAAGQPLFSIVDDTEWWVDANFKETDLSRIRPGQPVIVDIDMYPGVEIRGTVETLGPGSGAAFSLLPAQNATGNYVKVVQRFPVRIKLTERPTDPAHQLRVGASVEAVVDTTDGKVSWSDRIFGAL